MTMTSKSRADKIKDFCKLQHACQKLSESVQVIYDLAITHEELEELANSDDAVDQALAISPCMSIASYMKSLQDTINLSDIYEYYEFNPNETPVDEFITMDHISPSGNSDVTESLSRLEIDTNDVEGTAKANEMSNGKSKSKFNSVKNNQAPARNTPQPGPMRKGKNLDPALAINNMENVSKKNNSKSSRGSKNNNNDRNGSRNQPRGGKGGHLDPSLQGNSHHSNNKGPKSFNNNNNGNNDNSKEVDTEASSRLHAALGKYSLAPEYKIRQVGNGSFEAACVIKGLNTVISKGYGRNKKAAQHNAASAAFTSQELVDLLSSRT